MRMTRTSDEGVHNVTVPRHDWLRTGTLAGILDDVAAHMRISRDELIARLT
jgi:hypothetical protein